VDPRLVFEAVLAAAGFFAAFWIRGVRADIHEMLGRVQDHGERLAVVESKIEALERR
jgi:hypothetical protein